MPHLQAFREAMRHRHEYAPMLTTRDGIELERCACGHVRVAQRPEVEAD